MKGQVIMRCGDYGDMVYFLTSGTVEVLVGSREERVATFTPGTLFGEKAIFGNGLRTATVRALELSECRVISVLALLHILECFPDERRTFMALAEKQSKEKNTCAPMRRPVSRNCGAYRRREQRRSTLSSGESVVTPPPIASTAATPPPLVSAIRSKRAGKTVTAAGRSGPRDATDPSSGRGSGSGTDDGAAGAGDQTGDCLPPVANTPTPHGLDTEAMSSVIDSLQEIMGISFGHGEAKGEGFRAVRPSSGRASHSRASSAGAPGPTVPGGRWAVRRAPHLAHVADRVATM